MSHTSGPWEIKNNDGVFSPTRGVWIATMHTQKTKIEEYANARLISAAPELLELAEYILSPYAMTNQAIEKARAAIAKAKGQ